MSRDRTKLLDWLSALLPPRCVALLVYHEDCHEPAALAPGDAFYRICGDPERRQVCGHRIELRGGHSYELKLYLQTTIGDKIVCLAESD
jgi:hypothetical protein